MGRKLINILMKYLTPVSIISLISLILISSIASAQSSNETDNKTAKDIIINPFKVIVNLLNSIVKFFVSIFIIEKQVTQENVTECGYCQYLLFNGTCVNYECCKDVDCKFNEMCSNNTCQSLNCGYCQYAENHKCFSYECCTDSDCSLNYTCKDNKCIAKIIGNETRNITVNETRNETANITCPISCDDGNICTDDYCGGLNRCVHDIIIPCCGNSICEPSSGENSSTCLIDCLSRAMSYYCGDGICENQTIRIFRGDIVTIYNISHTVTGAWGPDSSYIDVDGIKKSVFTGVSTKINNLDIYIIYGFQSIKPDEINFADLIFGETVYSCPVDCPINTFSYYCGNSLCENHTTKVNWYQTKPMIINNIPYNVSLRVVYPGRNFSIGINGHEQMIYEGGNYVINNLSLYVNDLEGIPWRGGYGEHYAILTLGETNYTCSKDCK